MNEAIRPGAETPPRAAVTPALSVVVPTFNERDNVTALYRRLDAALAGIAWEVDFCRRQFARWHLGRGAGRWRAQDSRVRCIRRIGRRGLSGACIEGILASSAPCAAVIDADLQHDETQLPKMLALLQAGDLDLVVGSRYIEGGSADSFNRQRAGASAFATEVAKRVLGVKIADPMSGFFMIRRDASSKSRRSSRPRDLRSCSISSRPRRANCGSRKSLSPSARGCMARASSIPWWRWIFWGWCWRN